MEVQLSFVTLRCNDIETSRMFYQALGLDVSLVQHRDGSAHYACRAGDQVVELYPKRRSGSVDVRMGFQVEQLADVLQQLNDLGAEIVQTLGAPAIRYAVVRDPDGHAIELRS